MSDFFHNSPRLQPLSAPARRPYCTDNLQPLTRQKSWLITLQRLGQWSIPLILQVMGPNPCCLIQGTVRIFRHSSQNMHMVCCLEKGTTALTHFLMPGNRKQQVWYHHWNCPLPAKAQDPPLGRKVLVPRMHLSQGKFLLFRQFFVFALNAPTV